MMYLENNMTSQTIVDINKSKALISKADWKKMSPKELLSLKTYRKDDTAKLDLMFNAFAADPTMPQKKTIMKFIHANYRSNQFVAYARQFVDTHCLTIDITDIVTCLDLDFSGPYMQLMDTLAESFTGGSRIDSPVSLQYDYDLAMSQYEDLTK